MTTIRYELIGEGAEGWVYRVSPTVVMKVWHREIWSGHSRGEITPQDVRKRFRAVSRVLQSLPAWTRKSVRVLPLIDCFKGSDNRVRSYHPFIEYQELPMTNKWAEIWGTLSWAFVDLATNARYAGPPNPVNERGILYLCDVWPNQWPTGGAE